MKAKEKIDKLDIILKALENDKLRHASGGYVLKEIELAIKCVDELKKDAVEELTKEAKEAIQDIDKISKEKAK